MNKFKSGLSKTAKFLRKNIYYVLIIVAVAAIGTMVAVALTRDKNQNEIPVNVNPENPIEEINDPVIDPVEDDPKPIIFINPIEESAICQSYSDTELVFSDTLNQWSVHQAIDFAASEGSAVMAVYAGTVTSITNDKLTGYTVTVAHENGLATKYCGLNENIAVSVSQKIEQGTKIGEVGNTMLLECNSGPHLHFETYKDNVIINPAEYFVSEEK